MANTIDVDDILRALGKYKRHTIQQIIYNYFICVFLIGFPMLVYVFVGYSPPHKCKAFTKDLFYYGYSENDNTTYEVVSYEKCHTVFGVNMSNVTSVINVPCLEGYQYDIEHDTFVTEWNLVCDKAGLGELTQTIYVAGQMVGSFVFPLLSDNYGRKPVMVTSMLTVTSMSIVASFGNYYMYIVLRFLTGAFQQGIELTMAVYVLEQVPVENRGIVSAIGSFAWGVNVLVVAVVGYLMRNVNWRYVQFMSGSHGIHTIAAYWILYESLRWLIANNRMKQARIEVNKIAKINKVKLDDVLPLLESENEMTSLTKSEEVPKEDSNQKRDNLFTVVRHKRLLKISAIMAFTWLTNSVVYHGLILTSHQLAGNRYLNLFINLGVELPAMALFMILVKRLTRRQISVIFHSIAGVSLIASVIFRTFKDKSTTFETVSVIFSFIGKFGITGSFGLIFLFTPELYPTNLRNTGIGLGSIFARVGGILSPYASVLATYIEWGPGIIFGTCCVVAPLLQLLLPETSGKELPQSVQQIRDWDKDQEDDSKTTNNVSK